MGEGLEVRKGIRCAAPFRGRSTVFGTKGVVAVAIVLLLSALPAAAQDDRQQVCDRYWDYKFNPSGG